MNILMMGSSSIGKLAGAYPEDLGEGFSVEKMGTAVKFNDRGNLVAIGCYDGTLRVYDYDTLSLISQMTIVESIAISSIEWFKDYRYLLVTSAQKAFICDIINRECIKKFSMDTALIRTYICPSRENLILCCTLDNPPYLVNWQTDDRKVLPIKLHEYKIKARKDCVGGLFTPCGKYVFIGNTVGQIVVVNIETLKVLPFRDLDRPFHISEDVNIDLKSKHVVTNKVYYIVQLEFSKNGNFIAVNTRAAIHVFKVEFEKNRHGLESVNFIKSKEFKNAITNEFYGSCCFLKTTSMHNDSDYLLATNGSKVLIYDYFIYGELVKILECPYNESIAALSCHPQNFKYIRPVVVTATNGGNILFWTKHVVENWSAFSPDFDEIDCNEMYVERENEYDQDCENEFKTALYESGPEDSETFIDIFQKPNDMKNFKDELFYIPTKPADSEDDEFVILEEKPKVASQKKRKQPSKPSAKKKKVAIEDSDSDYEDD